MLSTRKIAVIIGSKSDLPQCEKGLLYLKENLSKDEVASRPLISVASIHRNTDAVLRQLRDLSTFTTTNNDLQHVLIIGAGWANHLTGTADAYLRYALQNDNIVVIGVAFEDFNNPEHTETAIRSITDVPGTQVVFDNYVGNDGFYRACVCAYKGELPKVKARLPKSTTRITINKALEYIDSLQTGEKP